MNIFFLGGNSFIFKNFIKKFYTKSFYDFTLYSRNFDVFFDDYPKIHFIKDNFNSVNYNFNFEEESVLLLGLWQSNPRTALSLSDEINLNFNTYRSFFKKINNQNIKHVVFFSSSAVYGEQCLIPISEKSDPSPLNFYGVVKLQVENLILDYCYKNNIQVTILRMSNVYGPYQYKQGLITTLIRNYNNKVVTSIWDDPNILRDYIYIDDISDLIHKILNKKSQYKIINASFGHAIKTSEIINLFKDKLKMDIKVNFSDSYFCKNIMMNNNLSNLLAKEEYQWAPKVSLLMGMKKLISNGI
jgi:UDP-glucose 4-epimerase